MGAETIPVVVGALGIINKGLEKYVDKILGSLHRRASKNYSSGNSSHPQKGSIKQVNSLVPKAHVLNLVLQRLIKQAKDYECQ